MTSKALNVLAPSYRFVYDPTANFNGKVEILCLQLQNSLSISVRGSLNTSDLGCLCYLLAHLVMLSKLDLLESLLAEFYNTVSHGILY